MEFSNAGVPNMDTVCICANILSRVVFKNEIQKILQSFGSWQAGSLDSDNMMTHNVISVRLLLFVLIAPFLRFVQKNNC